MNIIMFIQLLVIAPPGEPPMWLWAIIGILFILGMVLLAGSQYNIPLPKTKKFQ